MMSRGPPPATALADANMRAVTVSDCFTPPCICAPPCMRVRMPRIRIGAPGGEITDAPGGPQLHGGATPPASACLRCVAARRCIAALAACIRAPPRILIAGACGSLHRHAAKSPFHARLSGLGSDGHGTAMA
jgi:hypothetical protein